jgi:hypothetical protein
MNRHEQPAPRRDGRFAGMPFDLRRPTVARLRERTWNPGDARLFTPKVFGWGWEINLYWVFHPAAYLRGRGAA